jgi:phage terminase large subunit-like protein
MLVADELHVWRDSTVWNAIASGMGSVPNSLVVAITTASGARRGFLWDWLNGSDEIISVWDDDEAYCWWHGLPDGKRIDDRREWRKLILPSWITIEDVERQRKRLTRASFERYIMNRFPAKTSSERCFSSHQISACAAEENDFDFNEPFTLGIDGATSGDSFAIVAFQRRGDAAYTKEWVFDEPSEDTGHYPLGQIMDLIADICTRYWPEVVGIDPARMIVMSNQLKDVYGIETTSFAQNNPTMCQATSLVTHLVKTRALRLRGCPKLQDHLSNTVRDDKGAYGERFGKDDKRSKIDAAIALAIAVLGFDKLVGDGGGWGSFNG